MSDLRAPIARARGLGSAKDGTDHFIMQRLTAIALIPLSLWFAFCLALHAGSDYASVVEWVKTPWVTVLLVLFLFSAFYHASLGVQVVIEDYVSGEAKKIIMLILSRFVFFAFGATAILSVLRIAFGG